MDRPLHDEINIEDEKIMTVNLQHRHFLKLDDFTAQEIDFLLHLSAELKAAKRSGTETLSLQKKQIVLLFEKDSTRTRTSFEVAAYDQGAHVTYIGSTGSHMGSSESIKDTARVLGRIYDGIGYRGFSQSVVEELAQYAGVPVWNGLTNEAHPTQILADFLTMSEHAQKPLAETAFCFLGDVSSNMADSLLIGAAKMGMDMRLAGPKACWPQHKRIEEIRVVAQETGARILLTEDVEAAVLNCDFLYTDVWVSMGGTPDLWKERVKFMLPYQVNRQMLARTKNPHVKFMHCLPAIHNKETKLGQELYESFGLDGLEVVDDVFESDASIVFDQAENRLHTIKAVLVATLTNAS
jgi:ornithine carbamoyltransferase